MSANGGALAGFSAGILFALLDDTAGLSGCPFGKAAGKAWLTVPKIPNATVGRTPKYPLRLRRI